MNAQLEDSIIMNLGQIYISMHIVKEDCLNERGLRERT